MKKIFLFCLSIFLFYSSLAEAACTQNLITLSENIKMLTLECNASATASFSATPIDSGKITELMGWIGYEIRTSPGSVAPTTLYDIRLNDEWGIDLAGGTLANRSASEPQKVTPWFTVSDPIVLTITGNSQNYAQTVIKIFLSR